ncbi:MAG: class I SAM-dependent methyltransferase [Planctomycetes bacterium]|nr:class I SAM-dependent methyltransferase [Planctomycetota bacterium]
MTQPSYQKLRGGYYTPGPIASFLASWAIRSPVDKVLEPSCGDGNILAAAARHLIKLGTDVDTLKQFLHGVELDPQEAAKATQRLLDLGLPLSSNNVIHIGDFFEHCQRHLFGEQVLTLVLKERQHFDVVIGNPPFIRYQNFPEEHRQIAFSMMKRAGFHPNRLTNAWLPFLVVGSLLLKKDGRLAMVIPAELFQVNYAAEVRQFLSDYFSRVTLITFRQLVFKNIQQEVVLLLAERNQTSNGGIRTVELDNIEDLDTLTSAALDAAELKPMDHSTEKWTQYFLDPAEIHLLREMREHPGITPADQVLDVDVGIVTGRNAFFVLAQNQVKTYRLEPYLERIVSRSGHLTGTVFGADDWQSNVAAQFPAFLFTPANVSFEELSESLQRYIVLGESKDYHKGYKCRIRKRWYIVPSVWSPDAFMLRQVHAYPKMVLNSAQAVCTDTIHRVRFLNGVDGKTVTAAYLNSLTFAFSEVTGRSYGGGVLTFEPSEAERLPLPLVNAEQLDLAHFDRLLRDGDIDTVLDISDKMLLQDGLGLSVEEINMLRGIWIELRDRRINRK